MKFRSSVFSIALASLVSLPVSAGESREERVARVVKIVLDVQFDKGEQAAIEHIQGCYLANPGLHLVKLEACVAQDVAYSLFSVRLYKRQKESVVQPDYIAFKTMKARTLAVTMRAGLNDEQANIFITQVADMAYPVLVEEIKIRESKKKTQSE
ncbi:MAG: hypothetical protein V4633_06805 [Pseudomonadota bacterium]